MIPLLKGANSPLGKAMNRVDGFYLYTVGAQIRPLTDLVATAGISPHSPTFEQARYILFVAESALEGLVTRSIFRLRTSVQSGQNLLMAIRVLKDRIEQEAAKGQNANMSQQLSWYDSYSISSALTPFEAILGAELSLTPLYVVSQKAGYDTAVLIDNGAMCFPADIWTKAPEAVADLQQGTKCIVHCFWIPFSPCQRSSFTEILGCDFQREGTTI